MTQAETSSASGAETSKARSTKRRSGKLTKTVAFASKGGVGKTGLVASIAVCAQQGDMAVAVLDFDPRADMSAWGELRREQPPRIIGTDATTFIGQLHDLRDLGEFDLVLIDTAGGMSEWSELVIRSSDLCAVPTRPSFLDIRAANSFLTLAARVNKPSTVILNQCLPHNARVEDARALYRDYGVNAAPAVRFRVDHQDAIAGGFGVTEYNPTGAAATEVRALWTWIHALLWRPEEVS